MAQIKGIIDDTGTIYQCHKLLPAEYWGDLIEALTELEDNNCHRTHSFPKTNLHKVIGVEDVYRAYIDKTSGWRMHITYGSKDKRIHLCEVLPPSQHDYAVENIKRKKHKYKR